MIAKRPGGGYGIKHCHGAKRGTFIKQKRMTKEQAINQHQAIMRSKMLRGKA